ncbi:MAG: hypothetical protein Q4B60_00815 [Erysipelotrichaceae bacterium]|nr:hypothetical protein [Erysipelotrichaceae bacterium]
MNIDIKKLENISKELADLKKDDVIYVDEDGSSKYVIMPIGLYESVENSLIDDNDTLNADPHIRIIGPEGFQLSYDEYESVKKQINDAFEKVFKPKPENLN